MQKLWQKEYSFSEAAEQYCFAENVQLDKELCKFDAIGSIAHAQMLARIGVLNDLEFLKLKKALVKIIGESEKGQIKIEVFNEDVHTKLENLLIEMVGDSGKKIHTGRSRNDQILVDLRLYTKEKLFLLASSTLSLTSSFLTFAKKYEFVPMPGYTHMQKAMPSSIGMWAASFAESLLDDLKLCQVAFTYNDQSPLGSAAGYGVPLSIDRAYTAKLLGFAKVQANSLYCQSSRTKAQLTLMSALCQIMISLSRFSQDLLLFTSKEFDFFEVDKSLTSGSSIMPHKNNLDIMEILRARTQTVVTQYQTVAAISIGLPSGYNGDFAETKQPFMESINTTQQSIEICRLAIKSLKPKFKEMLKACSPEIYSVAQSIKFVSRGVPFRSAYQMYVQPDGELKPVDKQKLLKESIHIGATGNLGLKNITTDIKTQSKWWQTQQKTYNKAISDLLGADK